MNATSTLSRCAQILAAAIVLTGSNAFGQTIMTTSPTQSPLSWTITGTSGTQNLSFDGFNTALGTLQSVTINLTNVVVSGNATLTANTTGQSVVSARLEGDYFATVNGNQVEADFVSGKGAGSAVAMGSTYYVLADPNNGYVGTTPPVGAQNISTSPQSATPTVITSNLSFYEGGSNSVVIQLSGGTNLTSSTSGGFNTSVTGTGTGFVSVVYTYTTAVPEPSKTAAIMIGFALFVLVGRNYFRGRGIRLA